MTAAQLQPQSATVPMRGAAAAPRPPVRLPRLRPSLCTTFCLALGLAALAARGAQAHPHVWVTMTTEVIYAPGGTASALRQAWTFDDMYSVFATTGIKAVTKGDFSREELQPLAQINVESLKDYAYFTYARIDGKRWKHAFADPVDYWLDYDPKQTVLTLHFTLPFQHPVAAKDLVIEIYDPEFFIDFGFAKNDPVRLVGAPARCTVAATKPPDDNFLSAQSLGRSFIPSEANIGMGMDFANTITVKCP